MADFNRKKLQVFVSSTFSDLIKQRQAAVEAILAAGHIPAGMELFTAGDESQMEVIKQWIDESDVYLLILGGRYGSIEPKTKKSYTHLEYEYALAQGKPVFACVIKDEAIDARVKTEGKDILELENPQKLKEFRAEVLSKMSEFWEDTKDIKITITGKLSQLMKRENLVGWVRPSTQSDLPALADEIARLSKENSQLRSQLTNGNQEDKINGLTYQDLKRILNESGAADFLTSNRYELNTQHGLSVNNSDQPKVQMAKELCLRGLLTPNLRVSGGGHSYYLMTESGRAYLNKYESETLSLIDGIGSAVE
jgi:nucleoside 2-deoxyribosyltransferase